MKALKAETSKVSNLRKAEKPACQPEVEAVPFFLKESSTFLWVGEIQVKLSIFQASIFHTFSLFPSLFSLCRDEEPFPPERSRALKILQKLRPESFIL